ncbi:MAG: hypothetical protein WC812_01410 [Candidatus Pacearchaeota archaeon]|jgi:hypothetical protein
MKKAKLSTPTWILEGYDSLEAYNKAKGLNKKSKKSGKTYKIKICPKCKSDNVGVVLIESSEETGGGKEWECRKCKWKGKSPVDKELTEDEFLEHLDKQEGKK